jgi:hypothetical protein
MDRLSGMPPGPPKLLSTILLHGLATSEKFLELLTRDGFGRDIPNIRLPSGSLRIRSERLSCPGAAVTDSSGSPRPENETLSLALRYRSCRLISQMVMPVALFSATTSSKRPGLLMN